MSDDRGVALISGWPKRGRIVYAAEPGLPPGAMKLVQLQHEAPLGADANVERWLAELPTGMLAPILVAIRG